MAQPEHVAKVADQNGRFAVVEKLGAAAEVATELNGRSET
jgi:hypothetical protein